MSIQENMNNELTDATTIASILGKHNKFDGDLELDLLRYFEQVRKEIHKSKNSKRNFDNIEIRTENHDGDFQANCDITDSWGDAKFTCQFYGFAENEEMAIRELKMLS